MVRVRTGVKDPLMDERSGTAEAEETSGRVVEEADDEEDDDEEEEGVTGEHGAEEDAEVGGDDVDGAG